MLSEEEKTNKDLIADFQSSQTPDATPVPYITVFNDPGPAKPLIISLQALLPDTSVKLQSILQNNKNYYILLLPLLIHTQMIGIMCILVPNHHVIQAVISDVHSKFASTTSGCESNETDHPRTELDLH